MKVKPIALLKGSFGEWNKDNVTRLSAALAYYSVFSIAPLLLIAIAVAGLVFGREAAEGQIYGQLQGLVGEQGAAALQEMIRSANKPGTGVAAGLIGIVMLLSGASGVMGELKSALNSIWGVSASVKSGTTAFIRERFFSLTMVLGVGFLLLVSLLLSAVVAAIGKVFAGWLPAAEPFIHVLNAVVSFAVTAGLFMLIFRYIPDAKIAWRDVVPGGVVTAILFTVGEYAIGMYLGKGSFSSSYGAAGSLVVFLAWVYYSAQMLFFGAEFTKVYAKERGPQTSTAAATALAPQGNAHEGRKGQRRHGDRRQHPALA
jgi:membrane protein